MLISREGRRDGTRRTKRVADRGRVERHALDGFEDFDDHIQFGGGVVDDREPDAVLVDPRGDVEIGIRGFEIAGRMVVHQHLATCRESGQCQNTGDITPRHDPCRGDPLLLIERADEAHFAPARQRDRGPNGGSRRRRQASRLTHVLSGFFFAAGNSTLLRINRYPGELGCSDRSVAGLPIACCGSSGSWPPRNVHEPLPESPWMYLTHGAPSSFAKTISAGLSVLFVKLVVTP